MQMDLDRTFETLFNLLSQKDFGDKLGGEIPLFIQPFNPDNQLQIEEHIDRLISRLDRKGIITLKINLFELTVQILKEEEILDAITENEQSIPKNDLIATLDSVLDIPSVIIPKFQELIRKHHPDYVFISGVGHVYPFIRSHGILNNMDELTNDCKLVLFFPGDYNNQQLKLFGLVLDENYYRGINLNELTPNQ